MKHLRSIINSEPVTLKIGISATNKETYIRAGEIQKISQIMDSICETISHAMFTSGAITQNNGSGDVVGHWVPEQSEHFSILNVIETCVEIRGGVL